jgi:hypothetical protein
MGFDDCNYALERNRLANDGDRTDAGNMLSAILKGRQKNDGNAGQLRVRVISQGSAKRNSVHPGHADIQEDDTGAMFGNALQRFESVCSRADRESIDFQEYFNHFPRVCVVFHNQNGTMGAESRQEAALLLRERGCMPGRSYQTWYECLSPIRAPRSPNERLPSTIGGDVPERVAVESLLAR